MRSSAQFLNPSEAARRLGVSAKALRLYEQRGLVAPVRTAAGWRAYGPVELARAAEVVALRALGLSLAEVARVLAGDPQGLEPALAAHQTALQTRMDLLCDVLERVRRLRADLARGRAPVPDELARLLAPGHAICFDLPWPWGGERFEVVDIRPLNHIVGPLGSGKTQLLLRLAETIPGAALVGLERLENDGAAALAKLEAEAELRGRVNRVLAWLADEGAAVSPALISLVAVLEADGPAVLVVDMLEQGLDQPAQEALIAHLRRRGPHARPLFFTTRSSAILDLEAVGPDEAIIVCLANHSPPTRVPPYPGAAGYEAVATCLASPEVRARTAGVVTWRPQVA